MGLSTKVLVSTWQNTYNRDTDKPADRQTPQKQKKTIEYNKNKHYQMHKQIKHTHIHTYVHNYVCLS